MQKTSPHRPITSKTNHTIQLLRSLSDPKSRAKEGIFLIEGVKMVEEALRDNLEVAMIAASPDLLQHHGKRILTLAQSRSIEISWISAHLLDVISESKTPQPVLGAVKIHRHDENELVSHASRLIILAHRLQDPGNLGNIIRTVEAANASGVAITSKTVDPYNPKTVRASMGSVLRVPVVPVGNGIAFLESCKQRGFQTMATVLNGEQTHFSLDLTKPTVVILGQEGTGLPEDILFHANVRVKIPLAESIDSLNVATAAAVILYEAVRQRQHTGHEKRDDKS